MGHLDAATLRSYRARRLPPAALLIADGHLAGCEECREALGGDDSAAAGSLLDALTGSEGEHLSYDTLEAWIDGKLSPRAHRAASAHLQACARCVGDLADLRELAASTAMPRLTSAPRRGPSLLVAAVILLAVLGLASWLATRHRWSESAEAPAPAPPLLTVHDGNGILNVESDGSVHGMALSAADAAAARAALMKGRIDVTSRVAELQRERGTLMGATGDAPFDVAMPVATFLRETRPHFAWTSAGDGASYRVEVYDEARKLVLESPVLHDLAWTADRDLARGRTFAWQVVATRNGKRTVAPQPPAPEAHFGVVDDAAAARLDTAASSGSHLLLALAAAREGVMDDARQELDTLTRLNPGSPQVQRLARRLMPAPAK